MDFRTTLRAFHNDPAIKATYVARARAHQLADEIHQRVYYEKTGGKVRACLVGCILHSGQHAAAETEIGVPRLVMRIADVLFERNVFANAVTLPVRFLEAIPEGADLSMVWPRFAVWMLTDPTHGVLRFANTDQGRDAITEVAALYQLLIDGATVDQSAWDGVYARACAARSDAWRRRWEVAVAVAAAVEAVVAVAVAVAAAVEAVVEDWSRYEEARSAYALLASSQLLKILAESPVPAPAENEGAAVG